MGDPPHHPPNRHSWVDSRWSARAMGKCAPPSAHAYFPNFSHFPPPPFSYGNIGKIVQRLIFSDERGSRKKDGEDP